MPKLSYDEKMKKRWKRKNKKEEIRIKQLFVDLDKQFQAVGRIVAHIFR